MWYFSKRRRIICELKGIMERKEKDLPLFQRYENDYNNATYNYQKGSIDTLRHVLELLK